LEKIAEKKSRRRNQEEEIEKNNWKRVMIRIEDFFLGFLGFFDINPHSYNYT